MSCGEIFFTAILLIIGIIVVEEVEGAIRNGGHGTIAPVIGLALCAVASLVVVALVKKWKDSQE